MSDLILHPVPHSTKATPEMMELDPHEVLKRFQEAYSAAMSALQEHIDMGYVILDTFDAVHSDYQVRQYLMHLPDDDSVLAHNVRTEVLTSVEVRSGHSKAEKQDFDYLRCGFRDNNFVNVFDHPDKSRNTWNNVLARGWTWQGFQDAIYNRYPVPVTVSHDGDWFSLVDVIDYHEYNMMCEIIDTMNGAKDDGETED